MVRLLHTCDYIRQAHYISFNPTMVRLLPSCEPNQEVTRVGFNPTMVRLLLLDDIEHFHIENSFNPTMVRLLLVSLHFLCLCFRLFQSHNGAIAAPMAEIATSLIASVSIPQWCDCCSPTRTFSTGR